MLRWPVRIFEDTPTGHLEELWTFYLVFEGQTTLPLARIVIRMIVATVLPPVGVAVIRIPIDASALVRAVISAELAARDLDLFSLLLLFHVLHGCFLLFIIVIVHPAKNLHPNSQELFLPENASLARLKMITGASALNALLVVVAVARFLLFVIAIKPTGA